MKISNDQISIKIDPKGAELKSIMKDNIEYLWQGNPAYWKRTSPLLFPIVGRLLDNEFKYNGKYYNMAQHGIARDMNFELVSACRFGATYVLQYNKSTLEKYPFKFKLTVNYVILDSTVTVNWMVENIDMKPIYFSIGAHPAFNFKNGSIFEINKKTTMYNLESTPYIHSNKKVDIKEIVVDDSTFLNDAIILRNIDHIVLKDNEKAVEIKCSEFPYMGLWSSVENGKNAPFICIEPWYGLADFVDHDKTFIDKKGIKKLNVGGIFKASYKIALK